MMNSEPAALGEDRVVDAIVQTGARGAVILAALSTAVVIGLWIAFYIVVFSPRATLS